MNLKFNILNLIINNNIDRNQYFKKIFLGMGLLGLFLEKKRYGIHKTSIYLSKNSNYLSGLLCTW